MGNQWSDTGRQMKPRHLVKRDIHGKSYLARKSLALGEKPGSAHAKPDTDRSAEALVRLPGFADDQWKLASWSTAQSCGKAVHWYCHNDLSECDQKGTSREIQARREPSTREKTRFIPVFCMHFMHG